MSTFKNKVRETLAKVCKSETFNFFFSIVWFMNFLGGSAYLFWYSKAGLFGVFNILLSVFLLAVSYAGKPGKPDKSSTK